MKVLEFVDTLRRDSGITSFLMNNIIKENNNGILYDIMIIEGDEFSLTDVRKRVNVIIMPNPIFCGYFALKAYLMNYFCLHKGEYDVIHSHCFQVDPLLFECARAYNNCVCISHSHSAKFSDNFFKAIIWKKISAKVPEYADYWFACSNEAGIHLFGRDFPSSPKGRVIPNSIDCDKYLFSENIREDYRRKMQLGEALTIGHVGNFAKTKNHEFLINIVSCFKRRNVNVKLLLIGGQKNGKRERHIKQKIRMRKLENNVVFLGKRNDIPNLLFSMDVFVFPSLHEGFGISILEAETSGLPVIVSNGVPEDVKFSGCVTLDLRNGPNKWCDTILKISKVKADHLREDRNREVANSIYNAQNTNKMLNEFYIKVCNAKQK